MDIDILINEARQLYVVLLVKRLVQSIKRSRFEGLNRAVITAYCRYQRRLNRCVLCYKSRLNDCSRELEKKEVKFCSGRTKHCDD